MISDIPMHLLENKPYLLERTEESQSQRYFWDGNVAAYEENGERNYYLQELEMAIDAISGK